MNNIRSNVLTICKKAKEASLGAWQIDDKTKNEILLDAARTISLRACEISKANKKDIEFAKENKISAAKIDRLIFDEAAINTLATTLCEIAKFDDPIGKVLYDANRENGLHIRRVSTPIGVILAIFESRPNVVIDIAALAFKSSNAVILRSGSDCINSAKILIDIFRESIATFGINADMVQIIEDSNRDYVKHLLKMDEYIDVVIPRGGQSLIEAVVKHTKIPVFRHLSGNCHTYIHTKADFDKARQILLNAKLRRTSICGATETLLIDKKIAKELFPLIVHDLYTNGCEIRGDMAARYLDARVKKATHQDYATEYLDKIIAVKIVENIDEAIDHINYFGSAHTESIITEDALAVEKFFARINSAIVMHNTSTQFADGGEFGLGAEVGIATGKLHARGPVGLEQLTTYKYLVDAKCGLRK